MDDDFLDDRGLDVHVAALRNLLRFHQLAAVLDVSHRAAIVERMAAVVELLARMGRCLRRGFVTATQNRRSVPCSLRSVEMPAQGLRHCDTTVARSRCLRRGFVTATRTARTPHLSFEYDVEMACAGASSLRQRAHRDRREQQPRRLFVTPRAGASSLRLDQILVRAV